MQHTEQQDAWALIGRVPAVHVASTGPEGEPVLRTLHGVVHEDSVVFHGACRGEKVTCFGRPAVLTAAEILAEIPSHWTHPERACPATTFFRSAILHGVLEEIHDAPDRARCLQALMERFQPGGGYRPIHHSDPLYRRALSSLALWRLRPSRVEFKEKIGLSKPDSWKQRALEGLWESGQLPALRAVLAAWGIQFRVSPDGSALRPVMGDTELEDTVALLHDAPWNTGVSTDQLAAAHRESPAWVGATDQAGRVIASARALSDTQKLAYIMDVAVAPSWRGRGLGREVMKLLLDHPSVRGCHRVELHTSTAGAFYAGLGFTRHREPEDRETWRLHGR